MRCSLVSNKIIQARERLGLTQQQLAEKLCVTNKAVSKWECGVTLPDISLLVPLCRVLGLTVQELLDEGFAYYFVKPFDENVLASRFSRWPLATRSAFWCRPAWTATS